MECCPRPIWLTVPRPCQQLCSSFSVQVSPLGQRPEPQGQRRCMLHAETRVSSSPAPPNPTPPTDADPAGLSGRLTLRSECSCGPAREVPRLGHYSCGSHSMSLMQQTIGPRKGKQDSLSAARCVLFGNGKSRAKGFLDGAERGCWFLRVCLLGE